MNNILDMNKELKKIVIKMFEFAEEPYHIDKTKGDDWFLRTTWTEQQQDDFKDWLIEYLKKNPKAIKELTGLSLTSKKFRTKVAGQFIFLYGFTVEYD